MNTLEIEDTRGIQFCERQQLVIERGQGSHVWDSKGDRYLDFTSGWGVTCLGHSHPVVTEALCSQARKLMQNPNSGFTYSPSRALLLETLHKVLPERLERSYFANSGAEANDAAIKLARKTSGKIRVISTRGSFHGRTFNTLSVSGGTHNTQRFIPTLSETHFVEFGDILALENALDHDTAAVILEPVQGEGGVNIPPRDYLTRVSQLCREYNSLLIVDEIQTGFGRTGKFFAFEHSRGPVDIDILTMGKGIAGGFPFAGFSVTEKLASKIEFGDHGGTYCGNPLGCAVAQAVLNYLQEHKVAERALQTGQHLLQGLEILADNYPHLITEARGIGLLTALQMTDDCLVSSVTGACQRLGLLVTPTRNGIVRLIPDLLVNVREIDNALIILEAALATIEPRVAAAS